MATDKLTENTSASVEDHSLHMVSVSQFEVNHQLQRTAGNARELIADLLPYVIWNLDILSFHINTQ